MRNREEYGKDRKYKKYRKDRRKPAVWHMAAAVLFAAALILPAALAETARAAELERPGSAVQSDSAAPAGSVIQTGTAVPVTKNLSYGYSAAEAEIPISITNHTETVMEINNISCILDGCARFPGESLPGQVPDGYARPDRALFCRSSDNVYRRKEQQPNTELYAERNSGTKKHRKLQDREH